MTRQQSAGPDLQSTVESMLTPRNPLAYFFAHTRSSRLMKAGVSTHLLVSQDIIVITVGSTVTRT